MYVKRVQKELNILYGNMNTAAILCILLRGIFKIAKKTNKETKFFNKYIEINK